MSQTRRRSRLLLFVTLFVAVVLGGMLLLRRQKSPPHQESDWEQITLPGFSHVLTGRLDRPVDLWFPGADRKLASEARMIHAADDTVDRMRQVLILLLAGPRTAGMFSLFPAGAALRELYLYQGIVFVDLAVPLAGGVSMGCFEEALALTSIRRTLKENDSEVQAVRVLVNGRERETLAGHIALH